MNRLRRYRSDLLALLAIFALALLWFAPVLFPALSGRTLLPFDNLAGFEPWRTLYPNLIPHNDLLSDLVLENAVWKQHIRRTLADGQMPLWNPQIFTGMPFFAGGQASTLLSAEHPLLRAAPGTGLRLVHGLADRVWPAQACTFTLACSACACPPRSSAASSTCSAASLIVSVVFTMFMAAVAWLPLLLAVIEVIIRKQEAKGAQIFQPDSLCGPGRGRHRPHRPGRPSGTDLLHAAWWPARIAWCA